MKTILHLNNVNYTIYLNAKWQDKQEVISKVQEDFRQYTRDTHEDYRNVDKLCYLDMIRERLHMNFDEYIKDYVNSAIAWQQDIGTFDGNKFEVEFDYEFAENAYEAGAKKFYQSGENCILYNNIATIIKTVMEFEKDETKETRCI